MENFRERLDESIRLKSIEVYKHTDVVEKKFDNLKDY